MTNPFIVQNGLLVNADAVITGSLGVSGSFAQVKQLQVVGGGTPVYMDSVIITNVSSYLVIDSFPTTMGNSAKWLLSINDGSNYKTSELMCIWDYTGRTNFAEYTTNALGTVAGFFSVVLAGGSEPRTVTLIANPSIGTWTIKMLRFIL